MIAPLGDVRVVSIEQYAAGPYGTMLLADLGAEIIKIEHPVAGDIGRRVPPYTVEDDSLFFQSLNRNKRSVGLDLRSEEGGSILRELVSRSDAVYSNLRGDVPSKLGLRYGQLKDVNPRVVCCSLSGYGMTGPRASQPGFDYMVQGIAGWMSITGEPGSGPAKTGLSAVDFSAGLASAMSLLAGVHVARRDGVGCDCDVSLLETALSMLNYLATWHLSVGYQPTQTGRSSHPTLVPFGMFPTADGWIVAGGSKEKFWCGFAEALGMRNLLSDERFLTFKERLENRDVLIPILDESLLRRGTAEWIREFERHGVPCAPVHTIEEALRDEQTVERDVIFEQDHPKFGRIGQVASPLRVGTSKQKHRLAPELGADTWDVLGQLLGYSDQRLERLAQSGVISGR